MLCNINDTVIYGAEGVCRIVGISKKNLTGTSKEYYVLKPVYDERSTIFAPVHSEKVQAKMRPVLSREEIHALIDAMPAEDTIWIENELSRREQYKKILADGDRTELIRLIKTLYGHQKSQKEKGRKMHVADETFMRDAERMLHEEFAHVLNIDRDQVLPLILERIQGAVQDA